MQPEQPGKIWLLEIASASVSQGLLTAVFLGLGVPGQGVCRRVFLTKDHVFAKI